MDDVGAAVAGVASKVTAAAKDSPVTAARRAVTNDPPFGRGLCSGMWFSSKGDESCFVRHRTLGPPPR